MTNTPNRIKPPPLPTVDRFDIERIWVRRQPRLAEVLAEEVTDGRR